MSNKIKEIIIKIPWKIYEIVRVNSANPFYLLFSKVNRFFEEINRNKYLTLVPTNESKEEIKRYEELCSKIRDLIRSITKILDDYGERYMKIKFNSDDELPLNKTIEIPSMAIAVGTILYEINRSLLRWMPVLDIKMKSKDKW